MRAYWDNEKQRIVIDGEHDTIVLPNGEDSLEKRILKLVEITGFKFEMLKEPKYIKSEVSYR